MNPRKSCAQLLAQQRYTVVPARYDTLTARLVQAPASTRSTSPAAAIRAPTAIPTSACSP
jgi:hypothetical protein